MLELVPITSKQAKDYYELVDKSRDELTKLEWAKTATLASVTEFLLKCEQSSGIISIYGIKLNGKLAGVITLIHKLKADEIGYWLGIPYRNVGVMTEAVSQLLATKCKNTIVCAKTHSENFASQAVLKKNGFKEVLTNELNWVHFKLELLRK